MGWDGMRAIQQLHTIRTYTDWFFGVGWRWLQPKPVISGSSSSMCVASK